MNKAHAHEVNIQYFKLKIMYFMIYSRSKFIVSKACPKYIRKFLHELHLFHLGNISFSHNNVMEIQPRFPP